MCVCFVRTGEGRYAAPVSDLSDRGGVSCLCACEGRGEADITPSRAEGVVIVAVLGLEELELQQTFIWNFTSQGALSFPTVDTHTCRH